jgi:RES domain-containing protein
MTARVLREPMRCFRIGDPDGRYPIYSGEGAVLFEGRWHVSGQEVIYTSEHYGTAMLEKLARYNGILPPNQHFIRVEIPAGTSYEEVTKDSLPGWHSDDGSVARGFGSRWLQQRRSAILIVPSYVSREELNLLINPSHPQFSTIRPSRERPVWWDARLIPRK